MSVDLFAPGRRIATGVLGVLSLIVLLQAVPALAQSEKERRPAKAVAAVKAAPLVAVAAASASAGALKDGDAENRLLAIYQLAAAGRSREALAQAEHLARDYPHFQLAQLAVGDLLTSRTRPLRQLGDMAPAPGSSPADPPAATLAELLTESRQRVDAQRSRPPENSIPAQFLELPLSSRHAIAVDASRSRLYLFENTPKGLRLIADYYASVGKLGIDKTIEGDQRTPLGVYFITSRLDPATLKDFYGAGALPINYPNPLDQSRGKTGSGIWLHGTPPDQFSRAPLATDGCLALANPDLERILRTVAPRTTPVVIAKQLQWVQPHTTETQRKLFDAVLNDWRNAKSAGDMKRLLAFYAPEFESYRKKPLSEWSQVLQAETRALNGRELQLKEKSYLRWTDSSDTMVVTFGEVAHGARTGAVKRQYWMRKGQQWQIFFEGVIG